MEVSVNLLFKSQNQRSFLVFAWADTEEVTEVGSTGQFQNFWSLDSKSSDPKLDNQINNQQWPNPCPRRHTQPNAKIVFNAPFEDKHTYHIKVDHINTLSFALKVENRNAETKNLKMEVFVLKALESLRSPFFCRVFFCGRAEKFNFIIMTLVGKNLNELRGNCPGQRFTRSCGIQMGVQVVNAIQQLHSVGFIHRDIKPANFCVSLTDARQLVMVDFGMCRRYLTETGSQLRHPRWFVRGFKGTTRYAALATHYGRETSRKDDLESAFYLLVELLVGTLPWMTMEDPVHAEHAKQVARTTGLREFLSGCPKQLVHVMMYIDRLNYYDAPDYALIRGLLGVALDNAPPEKAFEWEEEMKLEQKKTEIRRSKESTEEDG